MGQSWRPALCIYEWLRRAWCRVQAGRYRRETSRRQQQRLEVGGFFVFKDTVDIYFDTSIQFLLSNHFKFSTNITSVALHTCTRTQHAEKRGFVL